MTAAELNTKIAEGTKKYGSKNAYLCSVEYQMAYKKWQRYDNNDKVKKEAEEVQIVKYENGYAIKRGRGYLVFSDNDFNMMFSGVSVFETYMQAKKMCNKLNYKVK